MVNLINFPLFTFSQDVGKPQKLNLKTSKEPNILWMLEMSLICACSRQLNTLHNHKHFQCKPFALSSVLSLKKNKLMFMHYKLLSKSAVRESCCRLEIGARPKRIKRKKLACSKQPQCGKPSAQNANDVTSLKQNTFSLKWWVRVQYAKYTAYKYSPSTQNSGRTLNMNYKG